MLCKKTKQTWYTDNKIRHNLHSSSRMYDERLADHLDVVDHLNVIVIYLQLTTAVFLTFTLRQMTMWPRNNVDSTLIQRHVACRVLFQRTAFWEWIQNWLICSYSSWFLFLVLFHFCISTIYISQTKYRLCSINNRSEIYPNILNNFLCVRAGFSTNPPKGSLWLFWQDAVSPSILLRWMARWHFSFTRSCDCHGTFQLNMTKYMFLAKNTSLKLNNLTRNCILSMPMTFINVSDIYQCQWYLSLSVTFINGSDIYQLQWRLLMSVTFINCSDVYQCQWHLSMSVTFINCSDVYQCQWHLSIAVTFINVSDVYQCQWRLSMSVTFINISDVYQCQWHLSSSETFINVSDIYQWQWHLSMSLTFINVSGIYQCQWHLSMSLTFINVSGIYQCQ